MVSISSVKIIDQEFFENLPIVSCDGGNTRIFSTVALPLYTYSLGDQLMHLFLSLTAQYCLRNFCKIERTLLF